MSEAIVGFGALALVGGAIIGHPVKLFNACACSLVVAFVENVC